MATKTSPKAGEQKDVLHRDPSGYEPIGSYAIIGNGRSAALVSRFGSIDWLCWPCFDSSSFFCALLDHRRGGAFRITPHEILSINRTYRGETNILTTSFHTLSGSLRLTDFMPINTSSPTSEILRIVECVQGSVTMEVEFNPRPRYGAFVPSLETSGASVFICRDRDAAFALHTDAALKVRSDASSAIGIFVLHAGEQRVFSLTDSENASPRILPLGPDAHRRLGDSLVWWEQWAARCRYRGPFRKEVVRSALVLKLLAFEPTGAIIAAPTTSLPEAIGEGRNWDYRYCWLRDASLSIAALMDLGYVDEGNAFLSWILRATKTTRPEVRILYDVHGNSRLPESTLDHLEGYRSSPPVRIGNAAKDQLQLDVYGEILLAVKEITDRGGAIEKGEGPFLAGIGEVVLRRWREPDEGIWETRAGRFHHTYSKVMCWSAMNTLLHLHEKGIVEIDPDRYRREREAIRKDIEDHAYDKDLDSYTGSYGGTSVDASLLLLGYVGFTRPGDARMESTYQRIRSTLAHNGLLRRYPPQQDGLKGTEGTFGLCSLWEVQYLIREDRLSAARSAFEHVLSFGNDVGLFAEEIDPVTGEALGNFPQAFTHLGIIDAALSLDNRRRTTRHHLRFSADASSGSSTGRDSKSSGSRS